MWKELNPVILNSSLLVLIIANKQKRLPSRRVHTVHKPSKKGNSNDKNAFEFVAWRFTALPEHYNYIYCCSDMNFFLNHMTMCLGMVWL